MIAFAREQLRENDEWRLLLEAYARAAAEERPEDDPLEGFLPRLDELDGVESEDLPRVHGKLIAYGLLEFHLTGPTTGVAYRPTKRGTALLNGLDADDAREDDADETPAAA